MQILTGSVPLCSAPSRSAPNALYALTITPPRILLPRALCSLDDCTSPFAFAAIGVTLAVAVVLAVEMALAVALTVQ